MLRRFAAGDEQTIAGLRAYWDAVVSGRSMTAEQSGLEPDLAATVQHILQRDDALSASPEFASTLLEQLIGKPAAVQAASPAPFRQPADRTGPVNVARTKASPVRAGVSRAWAAISAGSVLVIVLAIAAGFFIWNGNQKPAPAIIPLHSETTANGVLIHTMLEEHVDPGMLPGDPTKWIASFKFSLEPGEAWRDRPISCELARQYVVGLVESGTLAMINAGPFEVTRSDGTKESIQAGERANLQAGDSWVYLSDRTETNVQKWNPGSVPMVAFQTDWALDSSCETIPGNPEWLWHNSTFGAEFDPSRPVVATFEQVFVQPGATLSQDDATAIGFVADDTSVFRVIGIESGTLLEAWVPDALMQAETPRVDSEQAYAFTSGQVWTDAAVGDSLEGMERVLRAGDDEPLVLSVITWSYDDGDSAEGSSGVTIETILEEQIAAGAIPDNAANLIDMFKYQLEPGEAWNDVPPACTPDPLISIGVVESGVLSFTATGPFEVVREGGSREHVQAGQESTLHEGDTWVYFTGDTESFTGKRNGGTEPLVIVESAWSLTDNCNNIWANPEILWDNAQYALDFDPARPVTATFERSVVPPGASLTLEEIQRLGFATSDGDLYRTIAIESGSLEEVWVPDQLEQAESSQLGADNRRSVGPGEIWTPQTSLAPPEGWRREFRNASDEPMVLAIFAWMYGDLDTAAEDAAPEAVEGIARDTLLEHNFAADAVPRDSDGMFVMSRTVVPPGESITYPDTCGSPMLVAAAVESGSLAVMAESAIKVTRSNGSTETIEPPTPVFVHEGDSFIYPNTASESLSGFSNPGPGPLTFLQATWFPNPECSYGQSDSPERSQIAWADYQSLFAQDTPAGFTLRVEHVTIQSAESLSALQIAGSEVAGLPLDEISLLLIDSGLLVQQTMTGSGDTQMVMSSTTFAPGETVSLESFEGVGYESAFAIVGGGTLQGTLFTLTYDEADTG